MASKDHATDIVASPVDLVDSAPSSGRRPFHSHSRTLSTSIEQSSAPKPNRFSVQLPMQLPPLSESESPESTPFSLPPATGSSDGTFLTVLAAQERRVLELKEELQRAEADLEILKAQWAKHEEDKKREDNRRITKLQPLQTSLPVMGEEEDASGSSAWMQREMDRRKALMQGQRSSNRTVFSGSRHTRALSLLSPTVSTNPDAQVQLPILPPRKESLVSVPKSANAKVQREASSQDPQALAEIPILDASINLLDKGIDHELLLRTGKKFATDFKDGLWTFWEDIRQATVGEEATQPSLPTRKSSTQTLRAPRKQGSKNSLRSSSRGSTVVQKGDTTRSSPFRPASSTPLPDLADASFWTDPLHITHDAGPTTTTSTPTAPSARPQSPQRTSSVPEEDDAWDAWNDSPHRSRHSSSAASESNTTPSTVSGAASSRNSMITNADAIESTSGKDPIPWPSLSTIGPGALRRTASTLMREWERSLTPSPGKEFSGDPDYVGLKAEMKADGGFKRD